MGLFLEMDNEDELYVDMKDLHGCKGPVQLVRKNAVPAETRDLTPLEWHCHVSFLQQVHTNLQSDHLVSQQSGILRH